MRDADEARRPCEGTFKTIGLTLKWSKRYLLHCRRTLISLAKFYLSPSPIPRYYFLECDRYLRFMALPGDRRREEGIPRVQKDYSPVTQAVLDGGYAWEKEVLATHLAGRVVIPAGDGN